MKVEPSRAQAPLPQPPQPGRETLPQKLTKRLGVAQHEMATATLRQRGHRRQFPRGRPSAAAAAAATGIGIGTRITAARETGTAVAAHEAMADEAVAATMATTVATTTLAATIMAVIAARTAAAAATSRGGTSTQKGRVRAATNAAATAIECCTSYTDSH